MTAQAERCAQPLFVRVQPLRRCTLALLLSRFVTLCSIACFFVRRFGRTSILSLACTCRMYHLGLRNEVRKAKLSTAIVEWPSSGAVVALTRNLASRGLVNGTLCIVSKVIDSNYVLAVAVVRDVQSPVSIYRVLPRACVRCACAWCRGSRRGRVSCRFSFPDAHAAGWLCDPRAASASWLAMRDVTLP